MDNKSSRVRDGSAVTREARSEEGGMAGSVECDACPLTVWSSASACVAMCAARREPQARAADQRLRGA